QPPGVHGPERVADRDVLDVLPQDLPGGGWSGHHPGLAEAGGVSGVDAGGALSDTGIRYGGDGGAAALSAAVLGLDVPALMPILARGQSDDTGLVGRES